MPERECLFGDLGSFDQNKKTAVYVTSEKTPPTVLGSSLPYLDGIWKAYHVWMVTEPQWIWKRVAFEACDASGTRLLAEDCALIEGRTVTEWVRLRRNDGRSGKERYYPVYATQPTRLEVGREDVVVAGWDHEHCELCNAQIKAGHYGYVDPSEHWVCESCYAKYVSAHDLSFLCGP